MSHQSTITMRRPLVRRLIPAGAAFAIAAVLALAPGASATAAPIVGGEEASDAQYPFMTSIQADGKHFCGGSLITTQLVLTAAHCMTDLTAEEAENITVVAGRTDLTDTGVGQVRRLFLRPGDADRTPSVVLHPRYLSGERGFDAALLLLDAPVTGIAPVNLPTPGTDSLIRPGALATVIGWGNTDTAMPNFPSRLRTVDVPLLKQDECAISYDGFNRASSICAGVQGKDSCQGDSGGPLFRSVGGRVYQIGIVSYGFGCGWQGAPGVYTSLSSQEVRTDFFP